MKRKGIVLFVIFLFLGMSIISSASNKLKYDTHYTCVVDRDNRSEELLYDGNTAYVMGSFNDLYGLFEFKLDDLNNFTHICEVFYYYYLCSATWTYYDRFLIAHFDPFTMWTYIYELNPENCFETYISTLFGVQIYDLTCDPMNCRTYGCSGSSLYEIDPKTGGVDFIGSFGNISYMSGIACDANGILYGWDSIDNNLWKINTETAKATLIGPLGIESAHTGAFCHNSDILYLVNYTRINNSYKFYLYECNEDTGECSLVGQFSDEAYIYQLVIPFTSQNQPPNKPNIDGPTSGKPGLEYEYSFQTADPDGDDVYYYIEWGDWTTTYWIGPYASSTIISLNHTWTDEGIYTIRCRAKDICDHKTDWATFDVSMQKTKQIRNLWILKLLDRFPLIQQLLEYLGGCER